MTLPSSQSESVDTKAELFLKALIGDAIQAQCLGCNAIEWVIPIDGGSLDDVFIANYYCDECDAKETSSPISVQIDP